MKNYLALIIILLTLSGCATAAGYERMMNTWVGEKESHLISRWGAPDSSYESAEEFGGIGIEMNIINGYPAISEVDQNGAAKKAGLRVNDIITEVNGISTLNTSLEESGIKGQVGTKVSLKVEREGKKALISKDLIRKKIEVKIKHLTYKRSGGAISTNWGYGITTHQQINCATTFSIFKGTVRVINWNGNGCTAKYK